MPVTHLVATRPPLDESADAAALAPLIGQGAFEARLFLKYPHPEIVGAAADAAAAGALASKFRAIGVAVDVVAIESAARLSPPRVAQSFGFTPGAALFVFAEGDLTVPWKEMRYLVVWDYQATDREAVVGGAAAPAPKAMSIGIGAAGMADRLQRAKQGVAYARKRADLYFSTADGPGRIRLDQGVLEFSGLGAKQRPESIANWNALRDELKARAAGLVVDETMPAARIRQAEIDGKYVEPALAKEFGEVRRLLPDYYEFYSLLRGVRPAEAKPPALSGASAGGRGGVEARSAGTPFDPAPAFGGRPDHPERSPGRLPGEGEPKGQGGRREAEDVPVAGLAPSGPTCPLCGGAAGKTPLAVQRWEDKGVTMTMKQQWLVRSAEAPGCCDSCGAYVRKSRLMATALLAVPLLVLGALVGLTLDTPFVGIAAIFFYAMYLLKWGDYTWADRMTYGFEMEQKLRNALPSSSGELTGDLKFPVGCFYLLARWALCCIAAFMGLAVGAVIHG